MQIKQGISDISGDVDLNNKNALMELEKATQKEIINEMEAAVNIAQKDYGTDIFGFGETVFRKYPDVWRKISSSWEEIFKHVNVTYDVKVNIKRTGMLSEPIV